MNGTDVLEFYRNQLAEHILDRGNDLSRFDRVWVWYGKSKSLI